MNEPRTFDLVWTEAGLSLDAAPGATLGLHGAGRRDTPTLPHLTIGELGDADADGARGPDLSLVRPLGEGGMGIVWLARQASLGREVAIKQLKPGAPARAAERLLREGSFVGALEHPNIVPVHALGLDDRGLPALVMKKVDGVRWSDLIHDPAHPWWRAEGVDDPLARHLEILRSVCRAVAFAHDRGVLHRDIKPENVMVGRFGEVVLLDWGVATSLSDPDRASICGTPAYMAPELLDRTAALGPAADVYLLGACLHEVLVGHPPHRGADLAEVMRSVHAAAPATWPPDAPAELAEVVDRACARQPSDRYPSARDLERALATYLRHQQAAELAREAGRRMAELRALLAPATVSDRDRARAEELFHEARFAFRQALEAWPEARAPREGLVEALRLYAEAQLRAGSAEATATLAEQLADLGAATEDLRAGVAALRAERARLAHLASEQDRTVSAGRRIFALAVLTLLSAAATVRVVTAWRPEDGGYDHAGAFWLSIVFAGPMIVVMAAMRRRTFANRVNAGLSAVLMTVMAVLVANRAVGWAFDTPIQAMLLADLGLLTMCVVSAGAVATWRFLWAGVPYLLATPVLVGSPEYAPMAFGLAVTAGAVIGVGVTWRDLDRLGDRR